MKVVMITANDPAGTAIGFKRALERHTPHRCRLVTTEIRYNFNYEKDLHVPWLEDFDELEQVLKAADLFHFHLWADEDFALGPLRAREFLRGQPVLHHHHGEPDFRADPRAFAARELALGRRALVSTPDLLRGYPEADWIPNPVPLDDPDYLPVRRAAREAVVVGHSPTRRDLKNTAEFEAVMARLTRRDPRLRARVIEHTPHRQCLRAKRDCDVFFDHMQGYFGVSSLEALAQGVPAIAGLDAWNLECVRAFADSSEVPWVIARDADALEGQIEALAADRSEREALGARSRRWMERHWNERRIASRLCEVYAASGA